MKAYLCNKCKVELFSEDEVVFDGNELKVVDEQNPDWNEVTCNACFYGEDEQSAQKDSE